MALTLLYLTVVPVLVAAAALQLARLPAGQDCVRRLVVGQLQATLPGLQVDYLGGDYTSRLILGGVTLDDRFGDPAFHLDLLVLEYDLGALTGKTVAVEQVEVVGPRVVVSKTRSGALNLAELVVPTEEEEEEEPAPGPPEWTVQVDRLAIVGGRLRVRRSAGGPLSVEGLRLASQARIDGADLQAQIATLRARGSLPDGRRFAARLAGTAALAGEQVQTRLDVRVDRLLPRGAVELVLRARGPLSRVKLRTEIKLPGEGRLAVAGWAGVQDGLPRYDLRLSAHKVDPRRVMPELVAADINLALRARGRGVPLQPQGRVRVELTGRPSRVGQVDLRELRVRARTSASQWTVEQLVARTPRGHVEARGTGTTDRLKVHLDVDLPDLHRLPVPPGLGLRGAVRLKGRLSGRTRGPLAFSGELGARKVSVSGVAVDRARLVADLQGLPLDPRGHLSADVGQVRASSGEVLLRQATLRVKGEAEALQIAAEVRSPLADASLAATAAVSPRRVRARLRRLRLRTRGEAVVLRNEPVLVVVPGRRIALSEARVSTRSGTLGLQAELLPAGFPRLRAKIQARDIQLPHGERITGELEARLGRRRLDARVRGDLSPGGTRVSVDARLPVRYAGGAPIPRLAARRQGELVARVKALDLGAVAAYLPRPDNLGGRLSLDVDVRGPLLTPRGKVQVRLAGASYRQVEDLTAAFDAALEPDRLRVTSDVQLGQTRLLALRAQAPVGLRPIVRGELEKLAYVRKLPVALELDVGPVDLGTLPPVHPALAGVTGTLASKVSVQGAALRPRVSVDVETADLEVDQRDVGALGIKGTLEVGDRQAEGKVRVVLNRAELLTAAARLRGDLERLVPRGTVARAPLSGEVVVDRVQLAKLARLEPSIQQLGGALSARVTLDGTVRRPRGKARVELSAVQLDDVLLGSVEARARYDGRRVSSRFKLFQAAGGALEGTATIDPAGEGSLDATIQGRRVDLAVLSKVVRPVRESAGKLSLDLRASGPLGRPRVRGRVAMDDGVLRVAGVSRLTDIDLRVNIQPRRVDLAYLGARGERGTIRGKGWVTLEEFQPQKLALELVADDLQIDLAAIQDLVFSGRIPIEGEIRDGTLVASVAINDGELKMPQIEKQPDLHPTGLPDDVVFVEDLRKAGQAAGAAAAPVGKTLAYRVGLTAKPVFVRGADLDVEVVIDLKVRSDEEGRPRVSGDVTIRRGQVKVLGNPYEVRRAVVSFDGEPEPNPALEVSLQRQMADATIIVGVRGTAKDPELVLSSDPPIYDRSQVLSLIVTGRATPRGGEGSGDQGLMVASAITNLIAGQLLGKVAPKIGIDVLRVGVSEREAETGGESGVQAEAEVGKYLTRRLYIGWRPTVGQPTDDENGQSVFTNEGILEYRISARWLLVAIFGDTGAGGLDLVWSYTY